MARDNIPTIVIVGPTASGKTALGLELAEKYDGEIISADSRTVYRYLDIGTAKPTLEERSRVRHHLIDVRNPDETFTAADFQSSAKQVVKDIKARGKIPFIVGGTGLYIDAWLFDYNFTSKSDSKMREMLEKKNLEELIEYCKYNNIELPTNFRNKRHLIRAIEQNGINRQRKDTMQEGIFVVGISMDKTMLRKRIEQRAQKIFSENVVEEALKIAERYGWEIEAMTGNIYPLLRQVTEGKMSIDQAKEKFITLDWRLAKRQMTWFRRNQYIRWLSWEEARQYISGILDRKKQ
ncbi:MAG TPA: tRNA (adenosine(37)-N6)-dimethylallyltransferase MiaA [Verrucomicrobiae bacterium]|nr:tRNA (adenosine(37)-N6)-dimethylallyltransferase MiaA [Verrucomicrobiae bacterium]